MSGTDLAALIRYFTKTTSTTFTNADMLVLVNLVKDQFASLLSQRNNSLFLIPSTDALVADQREYALPNDVLNHIETVEIAFKQTTPIPYIFVKRINRHQYQKALVEANITGDYTNDEPYYFLRRRSIYLLSGVIDSTNIGGATVASGLRIVYRAYPADLANLTGTADLANDPSTTTFGLPKQLHELWAVRVSIIWKQNRPKPIPLSPLEATFEIQLEKQLAAIAREDLNEEIKGALPVDQGYDY